MDYTIYDCVLGKIVPIEQATTKGIRKFWADLSDDGYIEHALGMACLFELIRRGECPKPYWWDEKTCGKVKKTP